MKTGPNWSAPSQNLDTRPASVANAFGIMPNIKAGGLFFSVIMLAFRSTTLTDGIIGASTCLHAKPIRLSMTRRRPAKCRENFKADAGNSYIEVLIALLI